MSSGREVLSVSEALQRVNEALEGAVGELWVRGEVSEFKGPHASGHYYFRLKDRDAVLNVKIWRGLAAKAIRCALRNGIEVVALGAFDVWLPRGELSFIVERIEERGPGDLARRFEEMKQRLLAEGLFAAERKKPVPLRPRAVALITASGSAAEKDVLQTLAERGVPVTVWLRPARVQGEGAVADLVAALAEAAAARPDVVLLARGGGSLEDLWAFNEEEVVRAVAACPVPTLSGVGHEVDFTLCDFAADERAKTPTAAAERLAAGWIEARRDVCDLGRALEAALRALLGQRRGRVDRLGRDLRDQRPERRLERGRRRLYEGEARLQDAVERLVRASRARCVRAARALGAATPQRRLELLSSRAGGLEARLEATSPLGVLRRGYALVEASGRAGFLRRARDVAPGDALRVRLAEGEIGARVEEVRP